MIKRWIILLGLLAALIFVASMAATYVAESCINENNCSSLVTER